MKIKKEGVLGTGYLDEMEYFNDHGTQKIYNEFIEKGMRIDIVIHKNTSDFLRDLGSHDKINLFYTPNPPPTIVEMTDRSIFLRPNKYLTNGLGMRRPTSDLLKHINKHFQDLEKYPINPDKVGSVFDMIKTDAEPRDIVDFIQNS